VFLKYTFNDYYDNSNNTNPCAGVEYRILKVSLCQAQTERYIIIEREVLKERSRDDPLSACDNNNIGIYRPKNILVRLKRAGIRWIEWGQM